MTARRSNSRRKPSNGRSRRRMVRLLGKLGDLRPEERSFTLLLDDGTSVRCELVSGDWKVVERQKGRRTVVEGMAVWPMRGPLRRVECDVIGSGKREQAMWSRLPPMPIHSISLPPQASSPRPWGYPAIIGKWPGDESDEEIDRLLEEIS